MSGGSKPVGGSDGGGHFFNGGQLITLEEHDDAGYAAQQNDNSPRREEDGPSRFTSLKNSVKTWSEDNPKLAKLALTVLVLGIIAAIVVPVMNHYGFAHCGQEIAKFWNHSVVPFFTANKEGFLYVTLPLTGLVASIFALYHGGPVAKDAIMEKYLERRLESLKKEQETLSVVEGEERTLAQLGRLEEINKESTKIEAELKAIRSRKCMREIEPLEKEIAHYEAVLRARHEDRRSSSTDKAFSDKLDACGDRLAALEKGARNGRYPKPLEAAKEPSFWDRFKSKPEATTL
jgi:hypothetical protein